MKWKFNVLKEIEITVPFEVEADDFFEALKKGQEYVSQEKMKDKDSENAKYYLDTSPSSDQIPWLDDSKYLAKKPKKGKKAEG